MPVTVAPLVAVQRKVPVAAKFISDMPIFVDKLGARLPSGTKAAPAMRLKVKPYRTICGPKILLPSYLI